MILFIAGNLIGMVIGIFIGVLLMVGGDENE